METPPLRPVPYSSLPEIPNLATGSNPNFLHSFPRKPSVNSLLRHNSLSLSEFSSNEPIPVDEEFVNPFADESEFSTNNGNSFLASPRPSRILRNISSDENKGLSRDNLVSSSITEEHNSNQTSLEARYVPPHTLIYPESSMAAPKRNKNCFCDCARAIEEGSTCICEELADHLLHREGLGLILRHDDGEYLV